MKGRIFTAAVLMLAGHLLVSTVGAQRFEPSPENREDMEQDTRGAKICSAVITTSSRDTINVPDEWTAEDCRMFAATLNAMAFQLGCVFAERPRLLWGAMGGGAPNPNCGWGRGGPLSRERPGRERPFDDRQFDDPDRPRRRF